MRKALFTFLGALVLLACAPDVPSVQGAATLGNPDPYAIACNTGYTRMTPHLCLRTDTTTENWSVTATGCNTHNLTTVPTSSRAVLLHIAIVVNSSNVVNYKQVDSVWYNDATCTTAINGVSSYIYEEVAKVAGTAVMRSEAEWMVPVVNGTIVTQGFFTNTGVNTTIAYAIRGYYD